MEEAHPSKSRCREWLLSSSPWEKSVVRRKGWGVDHRGPLAGSWPLFRRIRRDGNRRGGKGWSGNRQARSGGTTRIGTGWLGENPSYWKGAGSTSVETVTQGPVVGVEGRRVVVGREGTPALVSNGRGIKKGDARFGAGLEDSFSSSCLLYTSPSPRDLSTYRMPSSA